MASCLPELAVSAVEYVAAHCHYAKVLLNYFSKLLLCESLPDCWQLWLHVLLDAAPEYFVVLIHPMPSFFFATPSLVSGPIISMTIGYDYVFELHRFVFWTAVNAKRRSCISCSCESRNLSQTWLAFALVYCKWWAWRYGYDRYGVFSNFDSWNADIRTLFESDYLSWMRTATLAS